MTYAVAAGCSHTAGVGNDIFHCYINCLERHYNCTIVNRAISGGSCNDVLLAIVDAVQQDPVPEFILAQWPNPFRRTAWIHGRKQLQNINSCDESFMLLLKNGEENFYEPWMQSVIIGNLLSRRAGIPIINILLESIDQTYIDRLNQAGVQLHTDEKLPGRTWFFDSRAQDNLHHSPQCHQQWAQRLIGIIDAHTTR
jgi:hypothetical protein